MEQEHEDKCKRCGQCCRIKTTILGEVFYSNKYCPYLVFEKDGRATCTIYKDRYEKAPWCKPVEEAIKAGLVPNDCGYAPEGYQSKIREKIDEK